MADNKAKPGRDSVAKMNLFSTWLEYRRSKGHSRADVIREVNAKFNRKYDNKTFHSWINETVSIPDLVITNVLKPELNELLTWFLNEHDIDESKIDLSILAHLILPEYSTLHDVFSYYFEQQNIELNKTELALVTDKLRPSVVVK